MLQGPVELPLASVRNRVAKEARALLQTHALDPTT